MRLADKVTFVSGLDRVGISADNVGISPPSLITDIRCSYHVASHVGMLARKSPDRHRVASNQPPRTKTTTL